MQQQHKSECEKTRAYFQLTVRARRMRDKSNRFQSTVCMTARGVIYAPQTVDDTKHARLLTGFSPPARRYGCHQIDVR
jgi:hypothetical protein